MALTRPFQNSIKIRARRLLASAARAMPITTAAVPATVTVGTSGAASTINGNTTGLNSAGILWNDPRLTDICGTWVLDPDNPTFGYINAAVSNKASGGRRSNINGGGKRFGFDGQLFDVCTYGGPIRLCATDLTTGLRQWYSADVTVSAAFIYTKFDFGSRAPRIIEIYFGGASSFWGHGFNVPYGDTIWSAPQSDAPRITGFGDSYGYGTNNDSIKSKYLDILGERFGVNLLASAASGSGYTLAVGGFTWAQRVANGDLDLSRIGDQDAIFILGSVNDGASSDTAVNAAVTACIQAIMVAQPNAIILVAGPQYTFNLPTSTARYAAVQAGVVAAAAGDPRVIYIDNSPAGEAWQTGDALATTLTGALAAATSSTLVSNWPSTTGSYIIRFSDGSERTVTLTNGSAAVTWTGAVTAGTAVGIYKSAGVRGNNLNYMELVGTHWNAAGNYYAGRRIADSIIAKLQPLAA